MANNGYRVLDCDMHVLEPPDLWQRFMSPELRERGPVGTTLDGRDFGVLIDGESVNRPGVRADLWMQWLAAHRAPRDADYDFAVERGWDGASQLEAMDREGIDVAVLFPSRGLFALGLDASESGAKPGLDRAVAADIARAYNDWLAALCSADPRRLYGAAMVAPHDVDAAVAETRRCVERYDFRSIFLLPGWVGGRPWHDRHYDPLWAVCQELDIAVSFHGGGPDRLGGDFGQGFRESLMMWHTFSHCLGPMTALVSMIGGGVLDRFPHLRVAFLEANCSWAPWLVGRLQDQYEDYVGRHEIALRRRVRDYFLENCTVSVEADEEAAPLYVQHFGDANVGFSTDYPHPDSKFPRAVEKFLTLPLSEETRRRILWDNSARLYRIES